eukprot:9503068-Pyramimonas_sp.AAC.1
MYADYDSYDNEQKCELVLFCKIDRAYEKEKKRVTLPCATTSLESTWRQPSRPPPRSASSA